MMVRTPRRDTTCQLDFEVGEAMNRFVGLHFARTPGAQEGP